MKKLIDEFSTFKMVMYNNNYLKLENYQKLIDITNNCIKFDNYIIEGEALKIESLNQFVIEIYGKIEKISIE